MALRAAATRCATCASARTERPARRAAARAFEPEACSDAAAPDEASSSGLEGADRGTQPDTTEADCGGAGEDFVLGMSKATPSGALSVAIAAAEPAPPLNGQNSWTVLLSGERGEAITAAMSS